MKNAHDTLENIATRAHLFTFAALAAVTLASGCGSVPGATVQGSAPEQTALLAIRNDVKAGLRYHRTVLGGYELDAGTSPDSLRQVAGRYRQLAEKVVIRSRPVGGLNTFAVEMDRAVAFERSQASGRPASTAALATVVGEYQGAFSRASAEADGRLGRRPPEPGENDLVWNPHVGRNR